MWIDIKGYEGLYKLSDTGEILSLHKNIIIKPWITNKGYYCVDLSKDGVRKHYLLHRLMAEHFVPNPYNKPIVLHKDNNKLNILPSNLEWGTYSENNAQAIKDGLNTIPRPDNRKHFEIVGTPYRTVLYGQDMVLNAIGYGSISVVQNLLHRQDIIKQGLYKGCKLIVTQPVEMVKIINS